MKDLFHKASLKLTALYLIIIMMISLLFSVSLYQIAANEIDSNFESQIRPVGQILRNNGIEFADQYIDEQIHAMAVSKAKLRSNLFALNAFIALAGGLLSYCLARMTLRPIEEAHKSQTRFASDASHELRTPIAAMRLENELTLTEPKLKLSQAKAQLESNIEELDKLTSLSEGLLKLARLDENGLELKSESLKSILESAVAKVEPLALAKKQVIKVDKLPKVKVNANKENLTEAFVTVLDNAVKYSPEKSKISVSSKLQPKSVRIDISDEGAGINPVDVPHIFDRFYRADQARTKNQQPGYGIGLSVAKSTIEAHQGEISVESKVSQGSTFSITLPR